MLETGNSVCKSFLDAALDQSLQIVRSHFLGGGGCSVHRGCNNWLFALLLSFYSLQPVRPF